MTFASDYYTLYYQTKTLIIFYVNGIEPKISYSTIRYFLNLANCNS